MNDVRPTTPWGTITAGMLAVLTTLAIAATQYGGLDVPLGALGPGAIIVTGVVILAIGLIAVLRSTTRERRAVAAAPAAAVAPAAPVPPAVDRSAGPAIEPPAGAIVDPAQTWIDAELAASSRETTVIPSPTDELTRSSPVEPSETPAAQGSADSPPDRGPDGGPGAQSSH